MTWHCLKYRVWLIVNKKLNKKIKKIHLWCFKTHEHGLQVLIAKRNLTEVGCPHRTDLTHGLSLLYTITISLSINTRAHTHR